MKRKISIIVSLFIVAIICSVGVYAAMMAIDSGYIGSTEITGTLYTYEDYNSICSAYGRTALSSTTGVRSAYCTVTIIPYNESIDPISTSAYYSGSSVMTTSTVSYSNCETAESEHNAVIVQNGVTMTLNSPLFNEESY